MVCRQKRIVAVSAEGARSLEVEEASFEAEAFEDEDASYLDDQHSVSEVLDSSRAASEANEPSVEADGALWGPKALDAARRVLSNVGLEGLGLYSFRAIANGAVLDIRLDKHEDRYGSPSLEEIEAFSRRFYGELVTSLGEEAAGIITVEVSSPGADRALRIPGDLERFAELPMTVTFARESQAGTDTRVLLLEETLPAEEMSIWRLADVRPNRSSGKSSRLTKKQTLERFRIPYASLQRVKLYVDI